MPKKSTKRPKLPKQSPRKARAEAPLSRVECMVAKLAARFDFWLEDTLIANGTLRAENASLQNRLVVMRDQFERQRKSIAELQVSGLGNCDTQDLATELVRRVTGSDIAQATGVTLAMCEGDGPLQDAGVIEFNNHPLSDIERRELSKKN